MSVYQKRRSGRASTGELKPPSNRERFTVAIDSQLLEELRMRCLKKRLRIHAPVEEAISNWLENDLRRAG